VFRLLWFVTVRHTLWKHSTSLSKLPSQLSGKGKGKGKDIDKDKDKDKDQGTSAHNPQAERDQAAYQCVVWSLRLLPFADLFPVNQGLPKIQALALGYINELPVDTRSAKLLARRFPSSLLHRSLTRRFERVVERMVEEDAAVHTAYVQADADSCHKRAQIKASIEQHREYKQQQAAAAGAGASQTAADKEKRAQDQKREQDEEDRVFNPFCLDMEEDEEYHYFCHRMKQALHTFQEEVRLAYVKAAAASQLTAYRTHNRSYIQPSHTVHGQSSFMSRPPTPQHGSDSPTAAAGAFTQLGAQASPAQQLASWATSSGAGSGADSSTTAAGEGGLGEGPAVLAEAIAGARSGGNTFNAVIAMLMQDTAMWQSVADHAAAAAESASETQAAAESKAKAQQSAAKSQPVGQQTDSQTQRLLSQPFYTHFADPSSSSTRVLKPAVAANTASGNNPANETGRRDADRSQDRRRAKDRDRGAEDRARRVRHGAPSALFTRSTGTGLVSTIVSPQSDKPVRWANLPSASLLPTPEQKEQRERGAWLSGQRRDQLALLASAKKQAAENSSTVRRVLASSFAEQSPAKERRKPRKQKKSDSRNNLVPSSNNSHKQGDEEDAGASFTDVFSSAKSTKSNGLAGNSSNSSSSSKGKSQLLTLPALVAASKAASKLMSRARRRRASSQGTPPPAAKATELADSLSTFAAVVHLSKACKRRGLWLISACKVCDRNNDHQLDSGEFGQLVAFLGFTASQALLNRMFRMFDVSGSGEIDYAEFVGTIRACEDLSANAASTQATRASGSLNVHGSFQHAQAPAGLQLAAEVAEVGTEAPQLLLCAEPGTPWVTDWASAARHFASMQLASFCSVAASISNQYLVLKPSSDPAAGTTVAHIDSQQDTNTSVEALSPEPMVRSRSYPTKHPQALRSPDKGKTTRRSEKVAAGALAAASKFQFMSFLNLEECFVESPDVTAADLGDTAADPELAGVVGRLFCVHELNSLSNTTAEGHREYTTWWFAAPSSELRDTMVEQLKEAGELASLAHSLHFEVKAEDLHLERVIGAGSFGEVWKGRYNGTDVAIKKLKMHPGASRNSSSKKAQGMEHKAMLAARRDLQAEIRILSQLRHPNNVLYIGAQTTSGSGDWCIVTEWCSHGSLSDLIRNHAFVINFKMFLKFAMEIALGMNQLHNNSIVHRDLKSMNLLVDDSLTVKVADFGLSQLRGQVCKPASSEWAASGAQTKPAANSRESTASGSQQEEGLAELLSPKKNKKMYSGFCGTPQWMAPEVLKNQPYSSKVDIFSYGVVLVELLKRTDPYFPELVDQEQLLREGRAPTVPKWVPGRLADLVLKCLSHTPESRPSFAAIINLLRSLYSHLTPLESASEYDNPRLVAFLSPTALPSLQSLACNEIVKRCEQIERDYLESYISSASTSSSTSSTSGEQILEDWFAVESGAGKHCSSESRPGGIEWFIARLVNLLTDSPVTEVKLAACCGVAAMIRVCQTLAPVLTPLESPESKQEEEKKLDIISQVREGQGLQGVLKLRTCVSATLREMTPAEHNSAAGMQLQQAKKCADNIVMSLLGWWQLNSTDPARTFAEFDADPVQQMVSVLEAEGASVDQQIADLQAKKARNDSILTALTARQQEHVTEAERKRTSVNGHLHKPKIAAAKGGRRKRSATAFKVY